MSTTPKTIATGSWTPLELAPSGEPKTWGVFVMGAAAPGDHVVVTNSSGEKRLVIIKSVWAETTEGDTIATV